MKQHHMWLLADLANFGVSGLITWLLTCRTDINDLPMPIVILVGIGVFYYMSKLISRWYYSDLHKNNDKDK